MGYEAKHKGKRRGPGPGAGSPHFPYNCEQVAPGVTLPCEYLSDKELAALSGPVKTYNLKDLQHAQ